jgi:hypothetical protein
LFYTLNNYLYEIRIYQKKGANRPSIVNWLHLPAQ